VCHRQPSPAQPNCSLYRQVIDSKLQQVNCAKVIEKRHIHSQLLQEKNMRFEKRTIAAMQVFATLWWQCQAFTIQTRNQKHLGQAYGSHGQLSTVDMDTSSTLSNANLINSIKSTHPKTCLYMVDDEDYDDEDDNEEEEYDPLKDGVDSIDWLPSIESPAASSASTSDEAEILPFFPLGGIVYTPNSEHVLNIFEPRYRQMYTDILMNGSKRFVVAMSHPDKPGVFAQTGVIFYLDDLKEVSEETGDQIKYICTHKVTERVKLERIVNPEVYDTRESYLKVEGVILKEDDDTIDNAATDENVQEEVMDENIQSTDIYKQIVGAISKNNPNSTTDSAAEKKLKAAFSNLVHIQHDLEEDVRFTRSSVETLAVGHGKGDDGLWQTIRLWQSFIEQRLVSRQNEMQMEFQEKLLEFLKKERGLDENELPSAIGFEDLSPQLQQEVQDLQKRIAEELQPLVLESTLAIQKILEADGHEDRCTLLAYFIDAEKKRLDAKKQLQGMFGGIGGLNTESVGSAGGIGEIKKMVQDVEFDDDDDEEDIDDDDRSSPSGSLLTDEPDAFQ
jgi:Lon protease-like protein